MQYNYIVDILESGINKLFNEESYKGFLKVVGRFHKYSLDNQLLIYAQMPGATKLAGSEKWEKLGYKVKQADEIGILVPKFSVRYIDNQTNNFIKRDELSKSEIDKALKSGLITKIRVQSGFTGTTVFDISATENVSEATIQKEADYRNKLLTALSSTVGEELEEVINRLIDIARTENEIVCTRDEDAKAVNKSVVFVVLNAVGREIADYTFSHIEEWQSISVDNAMKIKSLLEQVSLISDCVLSRLESEFGFSEYDTLDSIDATVKEEEIDTLLAAMEANAIRYKTGGGEV